MEQREKQIEEMAKIIGHCESTLHPVIECHNKATGCYCIENPCHNQRIADKLYNAVYRKQSEGEWINVDERLPEEEGWYLVYTVPDKKHKSINKAEFRKGYEWNNFEPYWRGAGGNWGNVAYWMPLPNPPKLEGGEG